MTVVLLFSSSSLDMIVVHAWSHKAQPPLARKRSSLNLGSAAGSQCGGDNRDEGHRRKEAEEWTKDLSTACALSGGTLRKEMVWAQKCVDRTTDSDKDMCVEHRFHQWTTGCM